jgi:hypothetical protein
MPAIRSSQSQVEANQLNAQKSTGPRTPDGKARSSQNALKHGLTAKTRFFPARIPQSSPCFFEALIEAMAPQGAIEAYHVERAAEIAWRLKRLPHFEAGLMTYVASHEAYIHDDGPRPDTVNAEQQLSQTLRDLNRLQDERRRHATVPQDRDLIEEAEPNAPNQSISAPDREQRNPDRAVLFLVCFAVLRAGFRPGVRGAAWSCTPGEVRGSPTKATPRLSRVTLNRFKEGGPVRLADRRQSRCAAECALCELGCSYA